MHGATGTTPARPGRRRLPRRSRPYRDTSLIRNTFLVGPYSRTMPKALWWSWGGWAVPYERGTPVPRVSTLSTVSANSRDAWPLHHLLIACYVARLTLLAERSTPTRPGLPRLPRRSCLPPLDRATREPSQRLPGFRPESRGQILVVTILHVPYSLGSEPAPYQRQPWCGWGSDVWEACVA